jgi:biotin-dependent enzyme
MFRKEALEKLSSPEQLDQLLKVTSPRGWLALLGLGILFGTVLLWSIFGSIPSTLKGQGILLRGDAVQLIDTPQAGRVRQIAVSAGEDIQPDQLVAVITSDNGDTEIHSPKAGRVLELRASEGTFVQVGTVLVSYELSQDDLGAVLYLPAADGKKVQPGMEVQVAPSTVSQDEYGVLLGRVKSVGDYPATVQGMFRVLGSDELVQTLSGQGASLEVRIEFTKANTPSGYQWSSPEGPPTTVQGGTFCNATIILGQLHPINMVLGS